MKLGFDRTDIHSDEASERLLAAPLKNVLPLIAEEKPDTAINQAVAGLCRAPILRKRPFNPKGSVVVDSTAELSGFFAFQGGDLWKVFHERLEPFLAEQGGVWGAKPDSKVQFSREFLDGFRRMAAISKALYRPNGSSPDMEYRIRIDKPGNVTQMRLDDGTEYEPGEHTLRWPRNKFKIDVSPGSPMANFVGMWSLFDMAANANARHPGPGLIELHCVFALGSPSCDPNHGLDGQPVVVRIQVLKPPNGVEGALSGHFLDLSGACPGRATER